jgi:hypothetical protein
MLDSSMLLGIYFFGLIGIHYHLLIDYDCRIIGMRSWVGGILVLNCNTILFDYRKINYRMVKNV